MINTLPSSRIIQIAITDVVILALVYAIPTISHILPIPMYFLDPMRMGMLAGFLITRSWPNAALLAFTLPLFSHIFTGHPAGVKAVLIGTELLLNLGLLSLFIQRTKLPLVAALFLSIILSKLAYYILKAICLQFDWLQGELFSTPLLLQAVSALIVSGVFALIWRNHERK